MTDKDIMIEKQIDRKRKIISSLFLIARIILISADNANFVEIC